MTIDSIVQEIYVVVSIIQNSYCAIEGLHLYGFQLPKLTL